VASPGALQGCEPQNSSVGSKRGPRRAGALTFPMVWKYLVTPSRIVLLNFFLYIAGIQAKGYKSFNYLHLNIFSFTFLLKKNHLK
jgi:hypothetical protein